MRYLFLSVLVSTLSFCKAQQVFNKQQPLVHTFSIVAKDITTGEIAVAVQSHLYKK